MPSSSLIFVPDMGLQTRLNSWELPGHASLLYSSGPLITESFSGWGPVLSWGFLGNTFIFQDSDGWQSLSFHTFMPYAHPSAPNLYYRINQCLYSLSYLIPLLNFTTFTSLHVFIFILYWKELKDRSYAFFFPLAQCLVCIRCLINTCWIKEWLEHLSSNVRVSAA